MDLYRHHPIIKNNTAGLFFMQDTRLFPHLQAAMVFLLIFITVLHLVTLAMLLVATLEKVIHM